MSRKRAVAVLLLFMSCSAVVAQQSTGRLRIVFAGDLMGHMPLHNAARLTDGIYDYESCFRYVKDYVESADLAVINLEVTLAGRPYTGYPCFSSPDAYAAAAKQAGFDIFATANNHCVDKGRRGIERTLRILDSLDVVHFGTYIDVQQRMENHPLIISRNGIRLALLNYTYGTNGISVPKPNVVNMIDTTQMLLDIKKAKRSGADYIIAILHWGVEYQRHCNKEQERLAHWLFDHDCDAIVGAHPHVVQNLTIDANTNNERYPEPVIYSLGNYFSNQKDPDCNGGIMVSMDLEKKNGITELYSCSYLPVFVHCTNVDGRRRYHLVPSSDALSHPDSYGIDGNELARLKRFDASTRGLLLDGQGKGSRYLIQEQYFYDNQHPARQWLMPALHPGYSLQVRPVKSPAWFTSFPVKVPIAAPATGRHNK